MILTIRKTADYIRQIEPGTMVSDYTLRRLVASGEIKPAFMSGSRAYLDTDRVLAFLRGELPTLLEAPAAPVEVGTIRPVK